MKEDNFRKINFSQTYPHQKPSENFINQFIYSIIIIFKWQTFKNHKSKAKQKEL